MSKETIILSGKKASKDLREYMKNEISKYKDKYGTQPKLVIIQVGQDKSSDIYIRNKVKACEEVGIKTTLLKHSYDATEDELLDSIEFFNRNDTVEGIIVQTPLPKHIRYSEVIKKIDPKKDVDGFHSDNMGRTCLGLPGIKPATALGVELLLEHYGIDWTSKDVIVIGRGQHVGLPISIMMGNNDKGTVTSCHINTKGLKEKCKRSDIIICAVGEPGLITADMVKEGAIVIDVGINRMEDGKLKGDVDFENIKDICSAISPVPGGVGPMTVASLLMNTLWVYKSKYKDEL